HHPLKRSPSRLRKATSSWVAAIAVAGGSRGRRSTRVTPLATHSEIPRYTKSTRTTTAVTKYGHRTSVCRNTRRIYRLASNAPERGELKQCTGKVRTMREKYIAMRFEGKEEELCVLQDMGPTDLIEN